VTDLSTFEVIIQNAVSSSRNDKPEAIFWSFISLFRSTSGINRIQQVSPSGSEQIQQVPATISSLVNTKGPAENTAQSSSRIETSYPQQSVLQSSIGTSSSSENIKRRTCIRNGNEDQTDDASNAQEKWILIGLPRDRFKAVAHIDIVRSRKDVDIFREIRKEYESYRKLRRRFLELHDVHKVHLVKVSFVLF